MQYYLSFLRAKDKGLFAEESPETVDLKPCRVCGQPTTAADLCAFCRLWEPITNPIQRQC
jgi:hypothetical protein